jgi:hypothetical protein
VLAWRGTRSYELKTWNWTTGKLISVSRVNRSKRFQYVSFANSI